MPQAPKPLTGKHALVLDDEFLIAIDLEEILGAAGAQVTCVGGIAQALGALKTIHFDFAILDFRLSDPGSTSAAVAAVLTERKTPFVFLTGMRGDDAQLRQFPNVPTVEKPYQGPGLIAAIERALAKP